MTDNIITHLAIIGVFISVSLIWFWMITRIAKYTVGKNPPAWKMFTFLLIGGPVGWIVIVLAFLTNTYEKL
jgi:hypothetical protein